MIDRSKAEDSNPHAQSRLAFVLMSAFVALAACASSPPEKGARAGAAMPSGAMASPIAVVFTAMDTDKDRSVSTKELTTGIGEEWASADSDQNGTASVIEIGNWAEMSLGSRDRLPNHMSFDRDFNGAITKTEFAERLALEFEQLDANADQQLTRAEMFFVMPSRTRSDSSRSRDPSSQGGRGGGRRERGGF